MAYAIGRIKNLKYIKKSNNRIEFKFFSDIFLNDYNQNEYYYFTDNNGNLKPYKKDEKFIFDLNGSDLAGVVVLIDYQNKRFKIEFDELNYNVSSIEILD